MTARQRIEAARALIAQGLFDAAMDAAREESA